MQEPASPPVWLIPVVTLFWVGAIVVIYKVLKWAKVFPLNGPEPEPEDEEFRGIDARPVARPGDVHVVYHTYLELGLLVRQRRHAFYAPPDDARKVLKRLLRWNLTFGLLPPGTLFVPWLAIGNYYAQKRSIEKQISQL